MFNRRDVISLTTKDEANASSFVCLLPTAYCQLHPPYCATTSVPVIPSGLPSTKLVCGTQYQV